MKAFNLTFPSAKHLAFKYGFSSQSTLPAPKIQPTNRPTNPPID